MILCAAIGEKFGKLPSEVLEHATTFDVSALDVKTSWEDYHSRDTQGKGQLLGASMTTDDLQQIITRTRS
jgi:hypothetical protein